MSVRNVPKNDVIFHEQGQPLPVTRILLLGAAQLNHLSSDGTRAVAIVPPGLVRPLPSMPAEVGHDFELRALNDCRVASLSTDSFAHITLSIDARAYAKVSEAGSPRLDHLLARQARFPDMNLLQRVVLTLLELVGDFGVEDARGMLLRISPTHEQLAELAGASRAKVTRALLELKREGIIQRSGRQLIVNTSAAHALVDGASVAARPLSDAATRRSA